MPLASVTKVFIGAAALEGLGKNYTFTTRLVAMGPIGADGSLDRLGVVGGGDPCLDAHCQGGDPERPLVAWAKSLAAQGVKRITRGLVIDGKMFSGPIRPAGYPDDAYNKKQWFSAPTSAFAWNDNCLSVRVIPGKPGSAAQVLIRPDSPRVEVTSTAKSLASGPLKALVLDRGVDTNTLTIGGSYGKACEWYDLSIATDPDLLAADHLITVLRREGIQVEGKVERGTVSASAGKLLVEHRSPLVPALGIFLQNSQNFYGEQLLRIMGFAQTGQGSVENGCLAVRETLTRTLAFQPKTLALEDGSGLSYGNQASASEVVEILTRMLASPNQAIWLGSLKDGDKYSNWKKRGVRLIVKTGYHAKCQNIAGYLLGQRRHVFCILLANQDRSRGVGWSSAARNELVTTLVESLEGAGDR